MATSESGVGMFGGDWRILIGGHSYASESEKEYWSSIILEALDDAEESTEAGVEGACVDVRG